MTSKSCNEFAVSIIVERWAQEIGATETWQKLLAEYRRRKE